MNINKVRSIRQLPNATGEISNKSYIEISQYLTYVPNDNPDADPIVGYASRKMTFENFVNASLANMMEVLEENPIDNEFGHSLKRGLNFEQLSAHVYQLVNGEGTADTTLFNLTAQNGQHTFTEIPKINKFITDFSENGTESVNAGSLVKYTANNNRLFITTDSEFMTQHYNVENMDTEQLSGITNAPSSEADKHNVYVFRIKNFRSNTWEAPIDGWFVCYGWVDELKSTGASNANRWVALEGQFNTGVEGQDPEWHIVQLQPMIPNEFCSYISFSVPVSKGMKLRLTTGFKVGTNSDKYQSFPGSLTNHIANAFVGGIYGSKCIASVPQD